MSTANDLTCTAIEKAIRKSEPITLPCEKLLSRYPVEEIGLPEGFYSTKPKFDIEVMTIQDARILYDKLKELFK